MKTKRKAKPRWRETIWTRAAAWVEKARERNYEDVSLNEAWVAGYRAARRAELRRIRFRLQTTCGQVDLERGPSAAEGDARKGGEP